MTIINPQSIQQSRQTAFTNNPSGNLANTQTNITDILTFGAPATVASFASTVGESLGIFNDEDVVNTLGSVSDGLANFYEQNREGLRLVGDIGGLFLPGLGAVGLMRGGAFFHKMLRAGSKAGGFRDRLLSSVFTSGQSGSQMMRLVRARDLRLGRAGVNPLRDAVRNKQVRSVYATKAADAVKETLAFEAGVYATMNESQILYPDDMSTTDLILLNAALPVGALGVEQMFLRTINRRSLQAAQKVREKVINPKGFTADALHHSRIKERSGKLTAQAMQAQAADEMITNPPVSVGEEFVALNRDQANKIKLEAQAQMKTEITHMFNDEPFNAQFSLRGDNKLTSKSAPSAAELNNVTSFLEENPIGMYGVVSLDTLPENTAKLNTLAQQPANIAEGVQARATVLGEQTVKLKDKAKRARTDVTRNKFTEQAKKRQEKFEEATKLAREADDLNQHQFFVLDSYGNVHPGLDYRLRWEDTAARTKNGDRFKFDHGQSPTGGSRMVSIKMQDRVGGKLKNIELGVDEELIMYGAKGTLSLDQSNALYKLTDYAIDTILSREGRLNTIPITPSSTHYQMDAAVELLRRDPNKAGYFNLGAGLRDDKMELIDNIALLSLKSKYQSFKSLSDLMQQGNKAKRFKTPTSEKLTLQKIADQLNLPQMRDGSVHPILQMFEFSHTIGKIDELDFRTLDEFKAQVEKVADIDAPGPDYLFKHLDVMGRQISNTANKKAVTMLQRGDVKPSTVTSDNLVKQAAGYKHQTLNILASARDQDAEFVAFITDLARQQAAVIGEAKNVGSLAEGILRGDNLFTTAAFRHGDNATLRAADTFVSGVDKEARKYVGELFKKYEDVFTEIRKPNNKVDLHSFNFGYHAAQSFHFGQAVKLGDNQWAYLMPDNAFNKQRLKAASYEEVQNMRYVPAATDMVDGVRKYKPLILTDRAHAALTAVSDLSQNVGRNVSVLKQAAGRGTVNLRPYHVPPSNFLGKDIMYAIENNSVVAAFAANSDTAVKRMADDYRSVALSEGREVILENQAGIARYHSLQDEAFERTYNMQDAMAQRGQRTGKSVNPDLVRMDDQLLGDALSTINREFESINRRTRAALFEGELNFVRSAAETDLAANSRVSQAGKSVYQEYERVIYGNPSLNARDNVGRVYQAVETTYDNFWRAVGEKYNLWREAVLPGSDPLANEAKYWQNSQYKDAVKKYAPVSNMEEFFQSNRVQNVDIPPSMKQHMGALNAFTANLALRLFEVGHAVLNLTSLAVTMPPVIKALNRLPDESAAAWRGRINSYGIPFNDQDAMFSPVRALTSGVHFMFTDKGREVWQQAALRGYFDQDVMEMMNTLIAPKRGYSAQLIDKIVKKASWVSDSSEQLARGIAFMTGANIALKAGRFNNPENVYLFAHRFADDVIGDFRPNNRPRIFQGALGMPLGLFQTFAVNYYQRLFNYVDTGNKAALFNQFATQSFIFGAESVPGFALFNDVLASNYDGTVNPVDKITNTFSQDIAEFMLYGSLANLPKMFGADDGVSIHTRGDMNLRNVPGLWSIDQTPVATLARDMFAIVGKSVSMLRDQGYDTQRTAEILSNYGLSRPFKNAMEIYAGYSTDRRGQVINSDTQDAFNIATRIAGLKPLSEARAADTFYRIQSTNYAQRGRMSEFREQIRSAMRRGNITSAEVEDAVRNYIRYGGNPANFGSWLADQASIALVDRGHAELMKAVKDPTRGYDVRRLMSLYSSGPGDAEFQ